MDLLINKSSLCFQFLHWGKPQLSSRISGIHSSKHDEILFGLWILLQINYSYHIYGVPDFQHLFYSPQSSALLPITSILSRKADSLSSHSLCVCLSVLFILPLNPFLFSMCPSCNICTTICCCWWDFGHCSHLYGTRFQQSFELLGIQQSLSSSRCPFHKWVIRGI